MVAPLPTLLTATVLAAVAAVVALDALALTVPALAILVAAVAAVAEFGLQISLLILDKAVRAKRVVLLAIKELLVFVLFVILRRMNYDLQSLQ